MKSRCQAGLQRLPPKMLSQVLHRVTGRRLVLQIAAAVCAGSIEDDQQAKARPSGRSPSAMLATAALKTTLKNSRR